jgi:hypothetical protein
LGLGGPERRPVATLLRLQHRPASADPSVAIVLRARASNRNADPKAHEEGIDAEGDRDEDVGIHLRRLPSGLGVGRQDRYGRSRAEDDVLLGLQDGRDSAQGDEAHGLPVRDDQDEWLGWLPGERHPLDAPEVPLAGRVDAIAESMLQVRVEDGSSAGFEFAHHYLEDCPVLDHPHIGPSLHFRPGDQPLRRGAEMVVESAPHPMAAGGRELDIVATDGAGIVTDGDEGLAAR